MRANGTFTHTDQPARRNVPLAGLQQHWRPFTPEYLQAMEPLRRRQKNDGYAKFAIVLSLILIRLVTGSMIASGLALLILGPFWLIYRVSWWDSRRSATPGDELLVADLQHPEDLLVEVFYEVDGVVRGRDRGVVWVDASGYCFYGHRSWFRIREADLFFADRPRFFSVPGELEAYRDVTRIAIGHQRRKIHVGIRELIRDGDFIGASPARRVSDQVVRYMGSDGAANLPTELPPLGLDPQEKVLQGLAVNPTEVVAAFGGVVFVFYGFAAILARSHEFGVYGMVSLLTGIWMLVTPFKRTLSFLRGRLIRASLPADGTKTGSPGF